MTGARLPLLAIIVLLLVMPALAEDFPALTGRVVDAADIIPAGLEQDLATLLEAHERETGNQVVVATLPSLGGRSIEETGVELGRHWQLGQKGRDNGVLLLVAPSERAVRIEVGYGLEGDLTDAIAKVIIESSILPRFRAGDLPGGIRRGAEDILSVLSGQAEAVLEQSPPRAEPWLPEMLPILIIAAFFVVMSILGSFGFGRGRWYGTGGWSDGRSSSGGSSGGLSGGGFSGRGGSFGGGGSSGSW